MRLFYTSLLSFTLLFLSVFLVGSVSAQFNPLDESCNNIQDSTQRADSELCNEAQVEDNPITGTEGVILLVANVLAIISGVIAVIIMIVAGITMMTSSGDAQKIKNSRNAIIYAIVGIVVVVLARSVVIFVINQTE